MYLGEESGKKQNKTQNIRTEIWLVPNKGKKKICNKPKDQIGLWQLHSFSKPFV